MFLFISTALFLYISSVFYSHHVSADHWNSVLYTERLLVLEGDMLNLCEYIMGQTIVQQENENDPQILKVLGELAKARSTHSIEHGHLHSTVEPQFKTSPAILDPLSLFRLRRRLNSDWLNILDLVEAHSELFVKMKELANSFMKFRSIIDHEADVKNTYKDFLQLQDFYSIPTRRLVEGQISDYFVAPMTFEEILDIANVLLEDDNDERAMTWLLAGSKIERKHLICLKLLASCLNRLNKNKEAIEIYKKILKIDPENKVAKRQLEISESSRIRYSVRDDHLRQRNIPFERQCSLRQPFSNGQFDGVCFVKGVSEQEGSEPSGLFKVEQLNNRGLYLVHELFSSDIADLAVREAREEMDHYIDSQDFNYWNRKSTHKIISDKWMPTIMERIVNMTFSKREFSTQKASSDWLEVMNLGPGMNLQTVTTKRKISFKDSGKSIHFVIFLTDAEVNIVMPKADVTVRAKKGNALMWQIKGKEDSTNKKLYSEFQICPVLHGSLWLGRTIVDLKSFEREILFEF